MRARIVAAGLVLAPAAAADEVVLWHAYRGAEEQALLQVIEAFEAENPGLDVDALGVPYEALASKLTTAIPRNNGPDAFIFAHERLGGWVASGLVRPVSEWESAVPASDFLPETLPPLAIDGELYALPLAFKSLVLFRRTDLAPEAPATLEDLLAVADVVSEQEDRYGLVYPAESFYYHAPLWFGFGGELGEAAPLVDFQAPAFAASLSFAQSLLAEGVLPEEITGALVGQLFNEGRAAFAINGPWFVGELEPDVPYALSPLPSVSEGMPMRPFLTDEAVFVSATAAEPGPASALASFLAGREGALVRARVGRQVVAHAGAWDEPDLQADPVLTAFRDQLPTAVPMDNRPEMRDVWEPADLAIKKALRGGATPEQAALAGHRRWLAITRPAPPERSPTPFVVLALTALAAGVVLLGRWWRGVSRAGESAATVRAWGWVAPAMVATVVLVFVPFVVGLGLSLFSHEAGTWTFVGLANFSAILSGSWFPHMQPLGFLYALAVTALWTVANVTLHVTLGLALALLLNQKGLGLTPLYRVVLILPWAVPNYITALIWKGMFHKQTGAINGLLELVGVPAVSWFSSFPTAFAANLCTNVWLGFPFMMVVCLGALQAIPDELYEAAEVDGAGWVDRVRHITLPLLRPALVPAILLGTVWTFNAFNIVYLVSGGEPDGATEILISEAYRWAFTRQEQYGYAAAYAVLIFAVLLGWSWVSTRIARRVEQEARG